MVSCGWWVAGCGLEIRIQFRHPATCNPRLTTGKQGWTLAIIHISCRRQFRACHERAGVLLGAAEPRRAKRCEGDWRRRGCAARASKRQRHTAGAGDGDLAEE